MMLLKKQNHGIVRKYREIINWRCKNQFIATGWKLIFQILFVLNLVIDKVCKDFLLWKFLPAYIYSSKFVFKVSNFSFPIIFLSKLFLLILLLLLRTVISDLASYLFYFIPQKALSLSESASSFSQFLMSI